MAVPNPAVKMARFFFRAAARRGGACAAGARQGGSATRRAGGASLAAAPGEDRSNAGDSPRPPHPRTTHTFPAGAMAAPARMFAYDVGAAPAGKRADAGKGTGKGAGGSVAALLAERRALEGEAEALRRAAAELARQEARLARRPAASSAPPALQRQPSVMDVPDMLPPADIPDSKIDQPDTSGVGLGTGKRKKTANSQYFNKTFSLAGGGSGLDEALLAQPGALAAIKGFNTARMVSMSKREAEPPQPTVVPLISVRSAPVAGTSRGAGGLGLAYISTGASDGGKRDARGRTPNADAIADMPEDEIDKLSLKDLRVAFKERFNRETTSNNRQWLAKRIKNLEGLQTPDSNPMTPEAADDKAHPFGNAQSAGRRSGGAGGKHTPATQGSGARAGEDDGGQGADEDEGAPPSSALGSGRRARRPNPKYAGAAPASKRNRSTPGGTTAAAADDDPSPKRTATRSRSVSPRNPAGGGVSASDNDGADERASGVRKHHRPWTLEETTALVEGVERYGVSKWAEIRKHMFTSPEGEASRTAVDLKDKWRNLLRSVQALQAGTSPTRSPNAAAPAALLRRVKALAAD